jgi:ligand-binding sensor domain-containing protein
MALLAETVLLADARVEIALRDDGRYRVAYGDLVVYENGRRRVRGRVVPYELRSIEQLRYDFERDVEAVGGQLAQDP